MLKNLRDLFINETLKTTIYLIVYLFMMGLIGYYSALFTISIKLKAKYAEEQSMILKNQFEMRIGKY